MMHYRNPYILIYLGTFTLTLLIGWTMAMEGFPYIVHWDEEMVFERPFKRFYQYTLGNFSATTTLFDWLLLSWYAAGFALGKMANLWGTFGEFKDLLILQDGKLLVWGRMLSAALVGLGNCLLLKLFHIVSQHLLSLSLIALCLILNPIVLPSLFLIKLDALVYAYNCLMLGICYRYIAGNETSCRSQAYFLASFALAVRVELLLFLCILVLYDLKGIGKNKGALQVKTVGIPLAKGQALAMLITLYPLSFLYTQWTSPPEVELEPKVSYGANIISRIGENWARPNFMRSSMETLGYYVDVLFWELGPLLLVVVSVALIVHKKLRFPALYLIGFLGALALFGEKFVHYAVSPALVLIVLAFTFALQQNKSKMVAFLMTQTLWMLTISLPYLFTLSSTPSPVILTHQYLMHNSDERELVAIETLSGSAMHPHITPCRIPKRIEAAEALSPFGGTKWKTYLKKGLKDDCRKLMDICELNYLAADPAQNTNFVNTYDIPHFEQQAPSWYIRAEGSFFHPLRTPRTDSFYQHIDSRFDLDTTFHKNEGIFDPRLEKINIRQTFYVFKRKDF